MTMLTKIKPIVLTSTFFVLTLSSFSVAEMRSTSGEQVNLRTGPGENFGIKWEYGKGYPVKIVTKKGKWIKVQDFENDIGWIHSSMLNNEPHTIVKVNKGKNKKINIRSGPGEKFEVVGQAYYGVVFEKKKEEKGWVKVTHESGLEGWIDQKLLWGF